MYINASNETEIETESLTKTEVQDIYVHKNSNKVKVPWIIQLYIYYIYILYILLIIYNNIHIKTTYNNKVNKI